MISRLLLSIILVSAGTLHILRPELFDPAIPFSFKLEINLIAGLLEIFLGLGLWIQNLREQCARMSALWFLILTPIHIYVSLFQISIFGISDPILLWTRTFFQPFLFFWALSLQEKGWIISQRWSDILFLNYEVDVTELQHLVPYPLDLFNGKAVVSIVPFIMDRIRFPFLPAVPGFSKLFELNLRTYVKVNGRPAVYFLTLDTNHLPAVGVARLGFNLPYRYKAMKLSHENFYVFKSSQLYINAKIGDPVGENDFHQWITERYALVTNRFGVDLWGVVEHVPWKLYEAKVLDINDHFSNEFLVLKNFLGASYAKNLDVRFRPFSRIVTNSRRECDKS